MTMGQRITVLRKEQNISQLQLAEYMDVSRQAVSKWENDQAAPDTLHLIRLADILATDVEFLATGASKKTIPEGKGRFENNGKDETELLHFPSPLLFISCAVLFFIIGFSSAVFILQ